MGCVTSPSNEQVGRKALQELLLWTGGERLHLQAL